jgi:hypothetical protein
MNEVFVKLYHSERIVGHISRDSTAIEAREKVRHKPKATATEKPVLRKRGRPKKGEVIPAKAPERLERQRTMTVEAMLKDLPMACDIGTKKNSKGFKESWKGYKLHLDTVDGDIPISAVLTSASVHDSQVALPLSALTERKLKVCRSSTRR